MLNQPSAADFATTHWSLVLAARDGRSSQAKKALAALCSNYWYPAYAFVRRCGVPPHDAEDIVQAFFARWIEREDYLVPTPQRGRFRSYLRVALRHFVANQRDRAAAQKRGGGQVISAADLAGAEERFALEVATHDAPDRLFDRRWALTVVDQTLRQLDHELARSGKAEQFAALRPFLAPAAETPSYRRAAEQLQMTENAVRVAVYRLRRRFGELLRATIAHTVDSPDAVEDEIQALMAALAAE
jgi:RNA polymerase sigma-70 factor (ECF subfamily)